MPTVTNAILWGNVVSNIEKNYRRRSNAHDYFQGFISSGSTNNPIAGLVNRHTKFFGPKVCQIFIIGKPYQETGSGNTVSIQWPPDGYEASKTILKQGFQNFAKYELHFYLDLYIAKKMKEIDPEAGAVFEALLQETADHIKEDCEGEMRKYGWFYEQELTTETDIRAETFYPVFDNFYKKVINLTDEG